MSTTPPMTPPMMTLVEDDDEEEDEAAADCVLLAVGEVVAKRLAGAAGSESWAPKMDSRRASVQPLWCAVSVVPPEGLEELEEGQHIFASIP